MCYEKDAQAIIEKALEEGVRFFDNAHLYSSRKAEERYGKFLTPKYRDVCFVMTKTLATNRENALRNLDKPAFVQPRFSATPTRF